MLYNDLDIVVPAQRCCYLMSFVVLRELWCRAYRAHYYDYYSSILQQTVIAYDPVAGPAMAT